MKGDIFSAIGKALIIAIPALALLGFAIPLALGMVNISLLSTYLALPMILATAAFLLFCKDLDQSAPGPALSPVSGYPGDSRR